MSARSYPYDGWVLLPSFRPAKVTFVESYSSWSNDDYGDVSETGKFYMRSMIHPTCDAAIAGGRARLDLQQARIDEQLATMAKRRAALAKAKTP